MYKMKVIAATIGFLLWSGCTSSEGSQVDRPSSNNYVGYKIPDMVRHRIHPRAPGVYDLPRGVGKYKLVTQAKTFEDALIVCANEGAWLAIIETYAEASILRYMFEEYLNATNNPTHGYYIGCDDRQEEGFFVSIKNEPMKASGYYLEWGPNEPNNASDNEDCCAVSRFTNRMNDVNCNDAFPFFCEAPLHDY